jgi:hypothetical protein
MTTNIITTEAISIAKSFLSFNFAYPLYFPALEMIDATKIQESIWDIISHS